MCKRLFSKDISIVKADTEWPIPHMIEIVNWLSMHWRSGGIGCRGWNSYLLFLLTKRIRIFCKLPNAWTPDSPDGPCFSHTSTFFSLIELAPRIPKQTLVSIQQVKKGVPQNPFCTCLALYIGLRQGNSSIPLVTYYFRLHHWPPWIPKEYGDLTNMDPFSCFLRLIPLPALPPCVNQVFRYFGIPEDITSDQQPQFRAQVCMSV